MVVRALARCQACAATQRAMLLLPGGSVAGEGLERRDLPRRTVRPGLERLTILGRYRDNPALDRGIKRLAPNEVAKAGARLSRRRLQESALFVANAYAQDRRHGPVPLARMTIAYIRAGSGQFRRHHPSDRR